MIGAKLVIYRQTANPAKRSEPQAPHAAHQSPACDSLTTTADQPYRLDKIRRNYLGIYSLSSRVALVTSFFDGSQTTGVRFLENVYRLTQYIPKTPSVFWKHLTPQKRAVAMS